MVVHRVGDARAVSDERAEREERDDDLASHGLFSFPFSDPDAVAEAPGPLEEIGDLLALTLVQRFRGLPE